MKRLSESGAMNCYSNNYSLSLNETNVSGQQMTPRDEEIPVIVLPKDQTESEELLHVIHNQKIHYLKKAVVELQKQNALLLCKLQCYRDEIDPKEDGNLKNVPPENVWVKMDTVADKTSLVESKPDQSMQANCRTYVEEDNVSPMVLLLVEKVKRLEQENNNQRTLINNLEVKHKSLLDSRLLLKKGFQRKLKLQKMKIASQMLAQLMEEKVLHLLRGVHLRVERSQQLEHCVSTMCEKFQKLLLNVQARSSQNRHDDLQRIHELEKKLSKSLETA